LLMIITRNANNFLVEMLTLVLKNNKFTFDFIFK
jgi:hypothetical protein